MQDSEIKQKIQDLELFLEHAEEICQIAKRSINGQIGQIRKECTHTSTKYVPDQSGNNDSYSYCESCGLEAKRFPIKGSILR